MNFIKRDKKIIENQGNDITIVIITYNRYPFLIRLLKFYQKYEYLFHILILDSSSDDLDDEMKSYLKMKNVTYRKYDPSIFFTEKISDGCQSIKTRFAVLCADDDFLIPSSIITSRDFLLKNEDYASAHGLYFNHTSFEKAQKTGFSIGPLYSQGKSVKDDSSVQRFNKYMFVKVGINPLYAVHRTNFFQLIWKETSKYVSDWGLSEIFPCALSLIYGKMKVLPVFYASRQPNTYSWYDENRHSEMFSEEKLRLASNGFAKHLSTLDKINNKESSLIVNSAFLKYCSFHERKVKNKQNRKFYILMRLLRERIRIRTRIQKLLIKGCHNSIYPKYMDDYIKLMESVMDCKNTTQAVLNRSRMEYVNQKHIG